MSEEPEKSEVEETSEPEETTEAPRGGGAGFPLFMGAVGLVIAAVCFKDGFYSPPEGWPTWKILFNQVVTVVAGLGGLAAIAYGLLRPRPGPVSEESPEEKPPSDPEVPRD